MDGVIMAGKPSVNRPIKTRRKPAKGVGFDPAEDEKLCELKRKGWTFAEIARELGYAGSQGAHSAYMRALSRIPTQNIEQEKQDQLAQLDYMTKVCHRILDSAHVTVSNGRLIYGPDGEPLSDDGPLLATVDRLIKIQERRSKLLGLDAPVKSRVEIITEDAADALILKMQAEIRELERDTVEAEIVPEAEQAEAEHAHASE